nr:MAG TPA: hypothetical protein [Caudoviricetes sp.]
MDYYYINITTKDGEVMNWDGNNFIEYNDNVDDVKQYDTMEQAESAWDKAITLARDMQAKDIRITKAEFLADIVDFGIETVKLRDL